MDIINFLAEKLSKEIGITIFATRGLIKLSISDELGPYFLFKQITFEQLSKVIQNSLKRRMMKLQVNDVEFLVDFLNNELIQNQSLILMSKI